MPWFTDPARLNYELTELEGFGFKYEVDAERRAAGQLVLHVTYPVDDTEHVLHVVYPTLYPRVPFKVFAPTLSLPDHQDPYNKLLCFVARIDSEWDGAKDTLGQYLRYRLPEVLKAAAGDTSVREAQEGAPVTGYMTFAPGSVVTGPDIDLPGEVTHGLFQFGPEEGSSATSFLRAAVLELADAKGSVLWKAARQITQRAKGALQARWVRLPTRPSSSDPNDILEEATSVWPVVKHPAFGSGLDVIGVVFKDRTGYRELHDSWLYIVRRKVRHVVQRKGNRRLPPGDQYTLYLARADRAGKDDLAARVPRLKGLTEKKVTILGLGALGSTMAVQLARAGVGQLSLADADYVQVGNLPRWALGWPWRGFPKADAISQYIQLNYPYTQVSGVPWKVGEAFPMDAPMEMEEEWLQETMGGAHLVVDCTAEFTAHHLLSDLSRERGLPYLWITATPGAWGGIVGRASPDAEAGCWKCFKRYQSDGHFPMEPAVEETGPIQPVGCFSPTFTGSGFDLDVVTLSAVRLAIATLLRDRHDAYPDFTWDVGFVDLWKDGRPIAPEWHVYPLTRHPACDGHG